ncbi:unnamed protein product [Meloidogyne enterolobii]|uniref:Uncharacterized protein n=1 Tax=Meloidogyne enterolobii TaxID=390850 RepID=A0ACB0YC11_MELEN
MYKKNGIKFKTIKTTFNKIKEIDPARNSGCTFNYNLTPLSSELRFRYSIRISVPQLQTFELSAQRSLPRKASESWEISDIRTAAQKTYVKCTYINRLISVKMFEVYLNEKPVILTGVELKRIAKYKKQQIYNAISVIEKYYLDFNSNKFYFDTNVIKFKKIILRNNNGKRFVIIEINYLEDIKLCKLTHKIEIEEEEFIKMIEEGDNDFEVKLEEVEVE